MTWWEWLIVAIYGPTTVLILGAIVSTAAKALWNRRRQRGRQARAA